MSTVSTVTSYPVDYTGRNPNNSIQNEQQVLTGVSGHEFYFIIPKFAPFFKTSLTINFKALSGEQRVLKEGIDYYLSHNFLSATKACLAPIYSSITFLNSSLVGIVTLNYQTLGGEWTKDTATLTEVLADRVRNPRITTWEQVVDMPGLFPVVDHEWNLTDMVGMSSVVASLDRLTDTIANTASGITQAHLNNTNNPHQVTAEQIGAVTQTQMIVAVRDALANQATTNSDNIQEGSTNLFFTQSRVKNTPVGTLPAAQNAAVVAADTVVTSIAKLQVQITNDRANIAKCATSDSPIFTGLTAEHIETVTATTATTTLDLSKASAWVVNINVSTSFVFDVSKAVNAAGNLVEFSLTTINNAAGNQAIAWPSSVKWADGVTPPRTTAANGRDEYYFYSTNGGASWTGSLSNINVK